MRNSGHEEFKNTILSNEAFNKETHHLQLSHEFLGLKLVLGGKVVTVFVVDHAVDGREGLVMKSAYGQMVLNSSLVAKMPL
jgi:hypothetical protein